MAEHAVGPPPDRGGADALHRARYRRILTFASLAFAQTWWYELALPRIGLRRVAERTRDRRMLRLASRFRDLAVDLGGLMIKVGQFMSSRLDVLPPEITAELAGLQDEVPAVPFEQIRAAAEAELGAPLEQVFASFDTVPLAAASLGQAHRATLSEVDARETGLDSVVVKVQRPGIDEIVAVDLAALRKVAQWAKRVRFIASRVDAPALVEEFAKTSLEEIDYLHEAANAERFVESFAADARVGAPEVVWERTTRKVLTLEDVTAIKINDVEALRDAGIDPAEVADVFAQVMLDQVFTHSFVHADPHPGNIFVTPLRGSPDVSSRFARSTTEGGEESRDGVSSRFARSTTEGGEESRDGVSSRFARSTTDEARVSSRSAVPERAQRAEGRSTIGQARGWRLTFIDFGMMAEVPDGIRSGLRTLVIAVASRDSHGLVQAAQQIGVLLPSAHTAELERALTVLFARFGGMGFNELRDVDPRELQEFGVEFGETVRSLPVQLPEDLLLLLRAVSLTSGMCSALDAGFNIWEPVEPYAAKLLRDESGNLMQDMGRQTLANAGILWRLPGRVDSLISRFDSGSLTFDTSRLEHRLDKIVRIARRAVSAVLFGGMLVGGALLIAPVPPLGIGLIVASALPLLHALFGRR